MTRRSLLLLLVAAATGCGGADQTPRAVALGEANCDFCHMTVERERTAAQLVPATGAVKVFDEAGCLLRYVAVAEGRVRDADRLWVHDETSGEWTDARAAWYVIPAAPVPGMMYGVLAYRDRARALEAQGEGRVVDFASYLGELRS
jgi:copper chaperone NosL